MNTQLEFQELEDVQIVEPEIESQEEQSFLMQQPFDPTQISIDTRTLSLDTLIRRIKHEEIELNSESYFQRMPNLWNDGKQSRLIESILINFPLPAFYFDGSNSGKWLVIDGLQRLSSMRRFIIDKELRLKHLEFLTQFNGFTYDDLPRDIQRKLLESHITAFIINPGTPVDVKFNIFKRINTEGISLEPQEIRHALFQGASANFIAELGSLEEFDEATDYSLTNNRRMLDRDFANRFLCFYLLGYEQYEPDLDTFMSQAMAAVSDFTEDKKQEIKNAYIHSLNLNKDVFGKNAFRKIDNTGKRKPINKAIFDAFSVQFAVLNANERSIVLKSKEQVNQALISLLENDPIFLASVSSGTSDKSKVIYRHKTIENVIQNIIHNYD